jgi:peptide/nickel transport system substrate-binding protein
MRAKRWTQFILGGTLVATVMACTAPAPRPRETGQPAAVQSSRGFTRAVATTLSELRVMILQENFAVAGKPEVETLVHQGLVSRDQNLVVAPRLAEAVPSVENGLWKVLPAGRMETTWRIKDGARWHDGTPFTADDLVFTARVIRDPAMADLSSSDFDLIEGVEAVDARTVRVTWKRPFIDADQLFGVMGYPAVNVGAPLPKHLLEQAYLEDKAGFSALPYWSSGFVGMGPYKIKDWVLGSGRMVLSASDTYILGRPRIDEIEIRMITDNNTMLANILSNEIDFSVGRNLSFEQSQTVREQWRGGTVRLGSASNPMIIYPGFLYADPVIVRDVRFRRAFLQAINRQELAEALLPGFSSVAHSFLLPSDPDLPALEGSIVKYAYDPQSTVRTLTGLGYTRGADGMFRDAAGQALTIEMRTTSDNEIHLKALYPTVDYLKAVGIQVTPEVIPPARQRDVEYRAKITGFQQTQGSGSLTSLSNFQSSQQKTAENGWRGQHTGYANSEFDALVDRYFTTIPKTERMRVAGQAINHLTDQLVIMTSFYVSATYIVANRLKNVPTNGSVANIEEWESGQ